MDRRDFFLRSATGLALLAAPRALAQDACATTPPDIEGPFHRAGAPFGDELDARAAITIRGSVRDARCRPRPHAVLDVWHADEHGDYDLVGFSHRRQVRCDAEGFFSLRTIHPGRYRTNGLVRPSHVHVKVHANGRPKLTTQLYFPGDPHNASDPWMRDALLLRRPPMGCCYRPVEETIYQFVFVV